MYKDDMIESGNNQKSRSCTDDRAKVQLIDGIYKEMLLEKKNSNGIFQSMKEGLSNFKNNIKYNIITGNTSVSFKKEKSIYIEGINFSDSNKIQNFIQNEFIYFSYRNSFDKIVSKDDSYTSDCGWGCMIRASQMILARAIIRLDNRNKDDGRLKTLLLFSDNFLSVHDIYENDDFSFFKLKKTKINQTEKSKKIMSIIDMDIINSDDVSEYYVKRIIPFFSIQSISRMGELIGKRPGNFFSDIDVIQMFSDIKSEFTTLENISIHRFQNNIIEKELIEKFFDLVDKNNININETENETYMFQNNKYKLKKHKDKNVSGIIFLSIRIGLSSISMEYVNPISSLFLMKNCIGFVGGENLSAFYYFGCNKDNELIFMDPHLNQVSNKGINDIKQNINSYLPYYIYKLSILKITPALTIGFVFNSVDDYQTMIYEIQEHSKYYQNYSLFKYYKESKFTENVSKSIIYTEVEDDFDMIDIEK